MRVELSIEERKSRLPSYKFTPRVSERGRVVSVGDGIAWIKGLPSAAIDGIVLFEGGSRGMIFTLSQTLVGAILLSQNEELTAGTEVIYDSAELQISVGEELLGRVVDPMMTPLDDGPRLNSQIKMNLDHPSPTIVQRDFVNEPLKTGNKILDTMIPIGKGQRQLLVGDNGLGKSSLAIDVVSNQKETGVICVYVLIGQKRSTVLNTIDTLKQSGALAHSVIVVAEASTLPGLQYLAPFSGCAVAEYFMKKGCHTLIVYDELTAHAKCYRELSLLLKRPPGREAYPPDIFFLHSRLLERSTCLAAKEGGGSMTALPIIETKEGELASYIPTNLISITDGQVLFDSNLFASGFFPAIDITRSVSRVGGKAQSQDLKLESARIKLDYLQFLELEVFTRFGAKLEASVQKKIERGRKLRELLKQDRLSPLSEKQQIKWLRAFNSGAFDATPLEKVTAQFREIIETT